MYKAHHTHANRIVALKLILNHQFADERVVRRFKAEVNAAAGLDHPHIVTVYHAADGDTGCPYYTMKYVDGTPLSRRISELKGKAHAIAKLMEQLARAVHHAHAHGILHRDLKPGNILVAADGNACITDFGLAKEMGGPRDITRTGEVIGTLEYMAPEQAEGKRDIGPAADIYSLGIILYELLTGRVPLRGATKQETYRLILVEEPSSPRTFAPDVDRNLEVIAMKCLAKDAQARYPTAEALADDLRCFLDGDPITARPEGLLRRAYRGIRRNRLDEMFKAWEPLPWDTLLFAFAAMVGLSNLLIYLLRVNGLPREYGWAVAVLGILLIFVRFVPPALRTKSEKEWQLIWIIIANFLGCGGVNAVVLIELHAHDNLSFEFDEAILYPLWAVINGVCFFAVGKSHSGYFFIFSFLFFALAILMSFVPNLVALIYSVACTLTILIFAFSFRRIRRSEERQKNGEGLGT